MQLKRFEGNPILKPNPENQWENLCVLNPGVIYDEQSKLFIMLYRAGGDEYEHYIRLGKAVSKDGFHFERTSDLPNFDVDPDDADGGCIEDPRIVKIEDIYYITYASRPWYPGRYWIGPERYYKEYDQVEKSLATPKFIHTNYTVSYLAMTRDFEHYKRLGRITDSRIDDRDVYLFPEKVNGKYVRISRPFIEQDENGNALKMPSIWITFSDDLLEWEKGKVLITGKEWWEVHRMGGACPPIKTKRGWFLMYHGKDKDDVYRVGAMMLDLNDPTKVLARTRQFFMEPEFEYEKKGFINGVVFPCGNVVKDGTLYVYYGCADQYIGVATADFETLIDWIFAQGKE